MAGDCAALSLAQAAAHYEKLGTLCDRRRCDVEALIVPIDGLVRSGRFDLARQMIVQRADWQKHPELIHRLAMSRLVYNQFRLES
jgi:hypothetical protein